MHYYYSAPMAGPHHYWPGPGLHDYHALGICIGGSYQAKAEQ